MANTIDADLILDVLSEQAVTYLGEKLAPINAFGRDFSGELVPQGKSLQVANITGTSATLKNPTSYNSGDTTTSNVAIEVNSYSQPMHITPKELSQRMRLENFAQGHLRTLSLTLSKVWTALVLSGTFTNTAVTVAQASFAAANARSALGSIMKCARQSLVLDGVAYANLAPGDKNAFQLGESGAYGYSGIHCQTDWTGATAKTYGFSAGPEALAFYSGIPIMDPAVAAKIDMQKTVEIPGLGLSVQINMWVDVNTRARWASYDVAFGAAVQNAAALTMIMAP